MSEKQIYKTKQRQEILNCILELGGEHFTASDIVARLNSRGNEIGQATVYRMIDHLAETGKLRKYVIDGTTAACYQLVGTEYEKSCREHFHLKCVGCGKLIHVECEELSRIAEHMQEEHGFSVDSSKTVFYGVCGDCKKRGIL